jgi:hypothetical protein
MALKINGAAPKPAPKPAAPPNKYDDLLGEPITGHLTKELKSTHKDPDTHKVTKTVLSLKDEQQTIGQAPAIPADKLARITVTASHTTGLPNYGSAKVGVSVTLPCHVDDLDAVYKQGIDWVSAKMTEALTND